MTQNLRVFTKDSVSVCVIEGLVILTAHDCDVMTTVLVNRLIAMRMQAGALGLIHQAAVVQGVGDLALEVPVAERCVVSETQHAVLGILP